MNLLYSWHALACVVVLVRCTSQQGSLLSAFRGIARPTFWPPQHKPQVGRRLSSVFGSGGTAVASLLQSSGHPVFLRYCLSLCPLPFPSRGVLALRFSGTKKLHSTFSIFYEWSVMDNFSDSQPVISRFFQSSPPAFCSICSFGNKIV